MLWQKDKRSSVPFTHPADNLIVIFVLPAQLSEYLYAIQYLK